MQWRTLVIWLSVAGFTTYVLFPSAPPWLAAQRNLIGHIEKSHGRVWYEVLLARYAVAWTEYTLYGLHLELAGRLEELAALRSQMRELQVAVQEWLRLIPDFHIAGGEASLSERGGGAMMTLTSLPLAWEVAS